MPASSSSAGRPYRSHSQPACIPCRKRKARCKLDETSGEKPCLMCKLHGSDCVFPSSANEVGGGGGGKSPAPKRQKLRQAAKGSESGSVGDVGSPDPSLAQETPFTDSVATLPGAAAREETHVIGPVQSPDAQFIADYLSADPGSGPRPRHMIVAQQEQYQPGRSVLFHSIRKYPMGYTESGTAGSSSCEVIGKLVEPIKDELIDVYVRLPRRRVLGGWGANNSRGRYFRKVHQCFPLLDERAFKAQYKAEKNKISPTLLSSLYAHTIVYWRHTRRRGQYCPDLRYIWRQNSHSLYSDLYMTPSVSTISSLLLNISGRPLTSMIGNGVLLSSAISLAHSFGLNRNCLGWDISPGEKCLRTRLWWSIVIHDKWSSLTYGTPPHLRTTAHDVPEPSLAHFFEPNEELYNADAASVFVAFATLAQVLDVYLDHIYDLRRDTNDRCEDVSVDIQNRLAQWEDSLPVHLRASIIRGVNLDAPGSSNLRLSYLYIRLLAQKLGIDDNERHARQASEPAATTQRKICARQAAQDIVHFVQELGDAALRDFWLSFNAFVLSSTVAFLLRSALEVAVVVVGGRQRAAGQQPARDRSLRLAWDMVRALRAHQERANWDLGSICIAQYADVVERLMTPDVEASEVIPGLPQSVFSEFAEIDMMFPSLWDMFNSS